MTDVTDTQQSVWQNTLRPHCRGMDPRRPICAKLHRSTTFPAPLDRSWYHPGYKLRRCRSLAVRRFCLILLLLSNLYHRNGNVTLFLQGATGNAGNFTVTPPPDGLSERSWWDDIVNDVLEGTPNLVVS